MVISIARQSIIIKCNMKKSVMLGNYEFYYAAGLLKKLYGLQVDGQMQPEELHAALLEQTKEAAPGDEQSAYLLTMLGRYEPLPQHDAQMRELFAWGEQEPNLWQVETHYKPKV
jgi:hypothetical protein